MNLLFSGWNMARVDVNLFEMCEYQLARSYII